VDVSFQLHHGPSGLVTHPAAPIQMSRMRHAAAVLQPGYVALFRGMEETPADVVDVPEVYVAEAGRFLRLPAAEGLIKRYGLTATKLPGNRILLVGGYAPHGNGITISEVLEAPDL